MSIRDRLIRGFRRALDNEQGVEAFIEQGAGGLAGRASVLAWSINSIHAYVFDTGNASVIRGASRILKRVDQRVAEGSAAFDPILPIPNDQIIYSGGGGGMAVVATEEVESIAAGLRRAVTLHTGTATCSVASVPLESKFLELKSSLHQRVARQRTLTGTDATVPVQFFEESCEICGRRAAAIASQRLNQGDRKECTLCHDRIEVAKEVIGEGRESADFEDIKSQAGDLGVIYLDGNRIGDTLAGLLSPLDYARFSVALRTCMDRVVQTAIRDYGLKIRPQKAERGYQTPIEGGDDLVMIVPGDVAVPMARDLLAGFESVTDGDPDLRSLSRSRQPLGASAGVAVGRLPLRHLLVEAEAFLESAKKRVYRTGCRSCLDFGVISDGQMRRTSHGAPRLQPGASDDLLFSAKPYDLDELASFSERRARIRDPERGIAPTQLHACLRFAEAGPQRLRNHLLYQIGRHEAWRQLVCDLAGSNEPLSDPDLAFSTLVPSYDGRPILDFADMLEMEGLWSEPESKEMGP